MLRDVIYEFGSFQFNPYEQQLFHTGQAIPLTPKASETLELLIAKEGRLVERAELIEVVWKNTHVEDANISVTIAMIRRALGDTYKSPTYIETVSRRGYRFIAASKFQLRGTFAGSSHERSGTVPAAGIQATGIQ